MTEQGEIIRVVDEDGQSHEFTLVDVLEVDAHRYALLRPEDEDEHAVIFRVEGEKLTPVDGGEEFDRVVEAIKELGEYDDLVVESPRDFEVN